MATRLIQVVSFANVAPAATVALPHNININGVQKRPDFVASDVPGFTILVTPTQVSVTNTNDTPMTVNVWLELKHTIPRQLGSAQNLSPQPFVASPGSSAGGSPTIIVQDEGVAIPGNPFTTLDFAGAGVTAADAGGGVAAITVPGGGNFPDITDDPGVEVAIAVPTTINAGTSGFPFTFTVNALNRPSAFFVRDSGPNNVRSFFDAYAVFGVGFAYFSVDAPVLIAGAQTVTVNNTCQALNTNALTIIQGFVLAASAAGYASQGLCMLRIINYGPNTATLNHNDGAAPAGSRMLLPGGSNLVMPVNGFVELQQFQFPSTSPNRAWACTSKNF